MAVIEISAGQVGAALRQTDHELQHRVIAGLRRGALRGIPVVVKDTPADRGQARAGWDVAFVRDGADLFNDAPHAGILEAGSRPHRPPILPILRWVVRKFGLNLEALAAGATRKSFRGTKRSFEGIGEVPASTVSFAWAIANKIAREGTAPHWMVRKNLKLLSRLAAEEVKRELSKPMPPPTGL